MLKRLPFLTYAKEALLLASLLFAGPAMAERYSLLGLGLNGMAFTVLLAACWGAILLAAYANSGWLRWLWAAILGAASYTVLVYQHASGQFMTYDVFITMLYSTGALGEALAQNGSAFLSAAWPTLALVFGVGFAPKRSLPLGKVWLVVGPLLFVAAFSALLFLRGGDGARGLPSGWTGTAYSALALYEEAVRNRGPRRDLVALPEQAPKARNIVLIGDESIAPNYLEINDPRGVETLLSDPPAGIAAHNFGIGSAITGCSAGVNQTLRFGGTRERYLEINERYPSIWAYAKGSGMRTIYLDGQRTGGVLHNMMDADERAEIDEFIQFDDVEVVDRDIAIARELARQIADPAPKFIFINKVGAHFPVHDKFPDSAMEYQPVLPRGSWTDTADTGDRTGFGGSPDDWRRYRNSYRNTLKWNVGEFFRVLFAEGDFSDTVMIYTADHGQVLHEDDSPGLTTHCSAEPPHQEGAVPLLAIEGKGASGFDFARWAEANHDRASHYMIFPTLLQLMGYAREDIAPTYGRSLVEESRDPMTFNARFNARLGAEPVWVKVQPDKLPRPPLTD